MSLKKSSKSSSSSSNRLSSQSNRLSSQSNRLSSQSNSSDSQIFDIILDLQSKHMDDFKKLFDLYKELKTLNLDLLRDLFKNNNNFLNDIIRVLTQYFDYLLQFIDYIKDKDIKRLNYKSPPNQPPPTPPNRPPPPPNFLLSIKEIEKEEVIIFIIRIYKDFESLEEEEKLHQILYILESLLK